MHTLQNRTTVVQDQSSFYIALQFYCTLDDTWQTIKYLSHPLRSEDEAHQLYANLTELGYMAPALYAS